MRERAFRHGCRRHRVARRVRVQPPKNASPLRYAIVPILLGVDGTDWAQTLHDAVALGPSAGVLSLFLYIVRHGALITPSANGCSNGIANSSTPTSDRLPKTSPSECARLTLAVLL